MSDKYPITTSADEVTRLRMQADLFRADADRALREIGVRPGWRCLDLCSGVGGITDLLSQYAGTSGAVVGLEYDQRKIEVARKWAADNDYRNVTFDYRNVTFVQGDGFAPDLEPASFDLVHARFALSIVPGGPSMLTPMLELLKPGGRIFLEEVELDSLACYPPHPAWDKALAAIIACFAQLGSDTSLGRKLNALLRSHDVDVSHLRSCNYALRAGEPMTYHIPLTFEAMRTSIVDLGLCAEHEIDATVQELSEHLSQPDTVTLSFTMVQAIGARPSP